MADENLSGTSTEVLEKGTEEKVEIDTEVETKETTEESESQEETKDEVDDGYLEVDFLKEKKKLTKDEAKTFAQKGLNYDHVKEKADKAEQELAELRAKIAENEMEKGKNALEKKLLKDGYDEETIKTIVDTAFKSVQETLESTKAEAKRAILQAKVAAEKEKYKNKPLFKELEPQIDTFMAANPQLDFATAYKYLFGELALAGKLDEMLAEKKKSAIADYTDNSKRSGTIKSDSTPEMIDLNMVLDKETVELSKLWKTDPKKIAKYVADEMKKKKG